MGFVLRKALSFGPLRLNLSKSGVGASLGVKGARIGISPSGRAYVAGGLGGFYFRENISQPNEPRQSPSPAIVSAPAAPVERFESADAAYLRDASQAELIAALQRVRRRIPRMAIVPIVALVLVAIGTGLAVSETVQAPRFAWGIAAALLVIGTVVGIIWGSRSDERDGVTRLTFNLEAEAMNRVQVLTGALRRLIACRKIWSIETRQRTDDWKRNAGVQNLVTRRQVTPSEEPPRGVVSNLPIVCLPGGRQTLYFFPNALFIYDSSGIGVVPYGKLRVEVGTVRFTEDEGLAGDSKLVGQTWQYVNKNGGPDRRFANNRELPIAEYGMLRLTSEGGAGLNELFYTSRWEVVEAVATAVSGLRGLSTQLHRSDPAEVKG